MNVFTWFGHKNQICNTSKKLNMLIDFLKDATLIDTKLEDKYKSPQKELK